MSLIQILIIIFSLFAITRVAFKFKRSDLSVKEMILWILFWIFVSVIVVLPQTTSFIANVLGVGRGVDVVVYLSVVVIFYTLFRIFIRLEKIERDITTLVRHISLKESNYDKIQVQNSSLPLAQKPLNFNNFIKTKFKNKKFGSYKK